MTALFILLALAWVFVALLVRAVYLTRKFLMAVAAEVLRQREELNALDELVAEFWVRATKQDFPESGEKEASK